MSRPLAIALALCGVLAVVVARGKPPPPLPSSAPAHLFSAGRALETVREVVADGAPRAVGSPANRRGVEVVLARLRALGLDPQVQEAFACGPSRSCATVRNVVARIPGAREGKAVLLACHHDSVPAGPGASDDTSGVAVAVEVARAIRAGPPLPRPVLLLVDDGEEAGLVGAAAFVQSHPWAKQVGAVVNLEARGTTGPSFMFETSGGRRWLAGVLRSLDRPDTSSLFPAVYDLLPNDTDLTVLRTLGAPGLNFAFIGGAARYHTARDDLAHLSRASLQHQGDNALAVVRALADRDLDRPHPGDAVFFDVLGWTVVSWPGWFTWLLVLPALALAGAVAARARREPGGERAVAAGLLLAAAGPLLAALLAFAVRRGLYGGRGAWLFPPHAVAFGLATWAAGLAGPAIVGRILARRLTPSGTWAGAAVGWAVLALAAALLLPGASHLFAVPALVLGACGLLSRHAGEARARGRRGGAVAQSAPPRAAAGQAARVAPGRWVPGAFGLAPVVCAFALFPTAWALPDALGTPGAPAVAALVALVAVAAEAFVRSGPEAPARGVGPAAPVAVLVGAAVIAAAMPRSTPDAPERLNVLFHEEAGRARWLVDPESGRLPEAMRREAAFSTRRAEGPPWLSSGGAFFAPAPTTGLAPPALTAVEEARAGRTRRLTARLVSRRGAPNLLLLLPARARVQAVGRPGADVAWRDRKLLRLAGGWWQSRYSAVPRDGIELRIEVDGTEPVEAIVVDESPGLPSSGAPLLRARPASAAPSGDGDASMVSARVRF